MNVSTMGVNRGAKFIKVAGARGIQEHKLKEEHKPNHKFFAAIICLVPSKGQTHFQAAFRGRNSAQRVCILQGDSARCV